LRRAGRLCADRDPAPAGLRDQCRNLRLPTLPRVRERGLALRVGPVRIGPVREQQARDLGVRGAAVAEDHRLQERGPAEPVDVVHVDPARRPPPPHRRHVPVVAARDPRGAAARAAGAPNDGRADPSIHLRRCLAGSQLRGAGARPRRRSRRAVPSCVGARREREAAMASDAKRWGGDAVCAGSGRS
jgi:hypothetical protein